MMKYLVEAKMRLYNILYLFYSVAEVYHELWIMDPFYNDDSYWPWKVESWNSILWGKNEANHFFGDAYKADRALPV
jgi:hypothetical protein